MDDLDDRREQALAKRRDYILALVALVGFFGCVAFAIWRFS